MYVPPVYRAKEREDAQQTETTEQAHMSWLSAIWLWEIKIPLWAVLALMALGMAWLILVPFGVVDWPSYVVAVIGAVVWGRWAARHRRRRAMLALAMFEAACSIPRDSSREAWERERERERAREEELAAEDPHEFAAPGYMEWRMRLSEQARRSIVREKWDSGELSDALKHRLPFLHAETFVNSLAQVERALRNLADLDLGAAQSEVVGACADLEAAIPGLKAVRDSVEHAEDRSRGRSYGKKITLAPVSNEAISAPSGGVLIAGMLNNNNFGWTAADGSYQEVEVSDATVEAARAPVQRALDAMPWKPHGYPHYVPG